MVKSESSDPGDRSDIEQVRGTIDLVVVVLLLFVGTVGIVSGFLVQTLANRDVIADLVAEEVIHSTILTDTQLIELVYGLLHWGGWGIVSAGLVILTGTALFGVVRLRSYRRKQSAGSYFADAVVGAVVTLVSSFVPFSPVIGGAVAGYLHRGSALQGAKIGVLVGVLVSVPVFVILGVTAAGLYVHEFAWMSFLLVLSGVVSVAFTVLFATVGGYVGAYIRHDRRS